MHVLIWATQVAPSIHAQALLLALPRVHPSQAVKPTLSFRSML